jgi:tRNA G18 (ribose-2'-O)-methylase SpoU
VPPARASVKIIMVNTRGYFGIGVEGISKAMNVGSILRSAHAFEASFVFTIGAIYNKNEISKSDTSDTQEQLPLYEFSDVESLSLPKNCSLVGVELVDSAIDLPSFRHPMQCAYVLGPERGSLSPKLMSHCNYTVQIPTKFCVNVGIAAAIIMYDRKLTMSRFADRPVGTGGPTEVLATHKFGEPVIRKNR